MPYAYIVSSVQLKHQKAINCLQPCFWLDAHTVASCLIFRTFDIKG